MGERAELARAAMAETAGRLATDITALGRHARQEGDEVLARLMELATSHVLAAHLMLKGPDETDGN